MSGCQTFIKTNTVYKLKVKLRWELIPRVEVSKTRQL